MVKKCHVLRGVLGRIGTPFEQHTPSEPKWHFWALSGRKNLRLDLLQPETDETKTPQKVQFGTFSVALATVDVRTRL